MFDRKETELLAPAGSFEGFEAVLGAGADAVYVGGASFGARAYAKNFGEEELLRAIDLAHLHGRKLYLTVNTLLKNQEIEDSLYQYILPYYREGLDAVLVQDLGVMRFLKRSFPDLPLHASTQMTVSGPEGMKLLEKEGLTRVVGARELSLKELRAMHESSPLEIEAFVHGALCYSYSGQCLMSSIFGGRSGNRGRCAQPCRLPYQTAREDRKFKGKGDLCPLSLKDICTIDFLPELLEAGVMSLKIEGRMKQPQYAAGVTGMYRKYLDILFEKGPGNYKVDEKDRRFLIDLFNRGGSCDGYLKQHNGPTMMAFSNEKKTGEAEVLLKKCRKKISGKLMLYPESPAYLSVSDGTSTVMASAGLVQSAKNRAMEESRIRQQMEKLGNTEFVWENLEIEMDPSIFVPVSVLNEVRREALGAFEKEYLLSFKRKEQEQKKDEKSEEAEKKKGSPNRIPLYVSCESREQALAALREEEISGLYLPYSVMKELMEKGIASEKELYLSMPHMVRGAAPELFFEQAEKWLQQGMKGFLVRNLEGFSMLCERGLEKKCVADASLYTWNNEAVSWFREKSVLRNTAPVELNEKELLHRDNSGSELLIYGYLPLMTSAQCVRKNMYGCDHRESCSYLKDRYGNEFQSRCFCDPWKMENTKRKAFCYNIIYNSLPYGLLKDKKQVERLGFDSLRLSFTIEDERETGKILREYINVYCYGMAPADLTLTRGHFKRGAE